MGVMVVILIIIYIFAVTFTSATVAHLDTSEKWRMEKNDPLQEFFGTLDRSIVSLFMAMSGGNDWGQYYDALIPLEWPYRIMFLFFIAFALFAVVNIVIGIFVDT